MSGTVLIPEFDEEQMATGFLWVTKVDDKGPQRGLMAVSDLAGAMRQFVDWEADRRDVTLVSRLEDSEIVALGQSGGVWRAIKAIVSADYYLTSATGRAYRVRLPRLIAVVSNNRGLPRIFWTKDDRLTSATLVYPLKIGNVYVDGRVCMGNVDPRCPSIGDIDEFIRRVVEAQASGGVLRVSTDSLYAVLEAQGWDESIGRRHAITLGQLIDSAQRPGRTDIPLQDPNETDKDIPDSLRGAPDSKAAPVVE